MIKEKNHYEEASDKRKLQQEQGVLPIWFTTNALITFEQKYLFEADNYSDQIKRICETLSKHTDDPKKWNKKFFEIIWNGWLALSTPVMANTGTNRGMSVSCSGAYTEDSVAGFFDSYKEIALLSKSGFGTSAYLGDIRPRGTKYGVEGKADGIVPVIQGLTSTVRQISQGSTRRGAGAWYIPIEHGDFWETCDYLKNNPDDLNIGWNISNEFIDKLVSGDSDSIKRYSRALQMKMVTGKGYFCFMDKARALAPEILKKCGVPMYASQLCTEIFLNSNEEYTYSCVLSSMNLAKRDEWKDTDAVFVATVFLDCVAQDFIDKARGIIGLEKTVKFTEDFRALGLGALGFHTYLQEKGIEFDSLEAISENVKIFKDIDEKSLEASQWMASEWGEPKFCKGYGVRNATRIAIAPNTTSALICGSVSQGIEPFYKNVFTQGSAAGDMIRINPTLLKRLKELNQNKKSVYDSILDNEGSVSHLEFLSKKEKRIFKTSFEIDQYSIIRMASNRQYFIDQGQSTNLFFSADESEDYISRVHKKAFLDPMIKSLYYIRSEAGVKAAQSDCVACEG